MQAATAALEEISDRLVDHDRVVQHMISAIRNSDHHTEPFSHFYAEELFPPALYAEILRRFPSPDAYAPVNLKRWSTADGKSTRDNLFLTRSALGRLDPADASFWLGVTSAITAPELKSAIFEVLAPDLERRFKVPRDRVASIPSKDKVILFRDLEDYKIEPHPDSKFKYVTVQLYLPKDNSQEDLGTSLYTENSLPRRLLSGQRFQEVKRFPFRPNSVYGFAVIKMGQRTSWHGRELIPGGKGVRNTIIHTYVDPSYDPEKMEYIR
jgi:hypothetical protein